MLAVPIPDHSQWRERWRLIGRRLGLLCVRYEVHSPAEPDAGRRTCYVIEHDRWLDRLVTADMGATRGWPSPGAVLLADKRIRALWSVRAFKGWFVRRLVPSDDEALRQLIGRLQAHPEEDVQLVPVAIFWGRAPAREHSWVKLLLAEDWAIAGRIRRFFAVLVHGRQVLIKVSEPVSLRGLVAGGTDVERAARKVARIMRVHFRRQRVATIGPDLSHRRLLVEEVLQSALVRSAVRREVLTNHRREAGVRRRARRYAREIAANYSYPVVRILERLFRWLWNRLYEGVDVHHMEVLDTVAPGAEMVYVPCHRSHIDYMLLSYVIYRQGLTPPHVAAGNNLNLPLIGPIMRGGGAFFMRRTLQGDALYAAVFRSYFRAILSKGFPMKYFIEGTRSRTGRLLNPKLGLVSMTVRSFLEDPRRPVVFMPVYFGYEKLIEGETFIGELRGDRKRKETLGGFLRSLRTLREQFGRVQVSFGEPIWLEEVLDGGHGAWREEGHEPSIRPEWLDRLVDGLGIKIMTAINEAAVANPVNLTSLVVLSMPKQAISEVELCAQLELYQRLLRRAPYGSRTVTTALPAQDIVRHCEEMNWLVRHPHPLGDVLRMGERRAVLASYYRNNIVHLLALPSLVASSLNNRSEITPTELRLHLKRLYPCLKSELFLRWSDRELEAQTGGVVDAMLELGLLQRRPGVIARPSEGTHRAAQLWLCAEIIQPFLQRYYLGVALLLEQGTGVMTKDDLVRSCTEAAEQLSMIYALDSPDLFESRLFENLADALLGQGWLGEEPEGGLSFGRNLEGLADSLIVVLRPRVRQTLEHLADAAKNRPLRAGGAASTIL